MTRCHIVATATATLCLGALARADITNITQGTTHPAIQDAIDSAVDFDEIVVDPGEYFENLDMLGKRITLRSQDPTDQATVASTIINGGGTDTVITCDSGETRETVVSGFIITGGASPQLAGAGMSIDQSSPTVRHCAFTGNECLNSLGAAYSYLGNPAFEYCAFGVQFTSGFANNAIGLAVVGGSAVITDCSFHANVSQTQTAEGLAAGMIADSADVTVTRSGFSGQLATSEHASATVGGILVWAAANVSMVECEVVANTAIGSTESLGGGVSRNGWGELTLTDCLVYGNTPHQVFGSYTDGGGNVIRDYAVPPARPDNSCSQDINGDGVIDQSDLGELLAMYGQSCP